MLKITINKQSNGHSMNVSTLTPQTILANILASTLAMGKYLLQTLLLFCAISSTALAADDKPTDNKPTKEATANAITNVQYATLPGNRLQISLELSEEAVTPLSFTIDNPARIAFDFNNTRSKLPKRSQPIGIGIAQSITTISTKTKTRVILNLTEVVPYQVTTQGKNVLITLDSESTGTTFEGTITASTTPTGAPRFSDKPRGISNIDFRRGEEGEGRVVINLTEANIPMDISEEFGKVVVKFLGIKLPDELRQTLDVLDFATPVKSISSYEEEDNVRIEIDPVSSNFEHVAYQANNIFTIELKPISKDELEEVKKEKFGYTGERLSLNFQDIPVRAVLQLIADFTSLNVVVSDSVDGNLTLRLKNVPWDQALDIILKAKGLSKRESGTVMMIAPSEEIAAQEKIDLEAQQSVTELAPIRSAFFTINFAKVGELAALFSGGGGGGGDGEDGGGGTSNGILSPRGSVIIDERTNTLIIKDTEEVISEIRRTLKKLDIPIRQVMISSRIVVAQDAFTKELGARFGATSVSSSSNGFGVTTGSFRGADTITSSGLDNLAAGGVPEPFGIPAGAAASDRLNVDLGVNGAAGSLAFAVLTGSSLIDLEISALQAENTGEIISSPRVVTADRKEAHIEQGVEIPYLSAASSGATQVQFKKAVLSIVVTPQITPDDRVIMDLSVTNDTVGDIFAGVPSIDTREVGTQVLVNNGDTVVLGGIYQQITRNEIDKVPFLGDIPIIGYFFRRTLESDEKQELLIFVTPKILKDTLSL
ncbi:Type IV pilus biogenesis protein PilQ [hydrothermal vent metagenome]|uniref:Type IV pilus biogenesis protein PilQ n=1 Tax=hydrothermal vent metagenome TaxID=652676 RepID=A0A3B0W9V8_9ZZZZ